MTGKIQHLTDHSAQFKQPIYGLYYLIARYENYQMLTKRNNDHIAEMA